MEIVYRKAQAEDLSKIITFVDYWLSGRGGVGIVAGVSNDYFVAIHQHVDYLKRYTVLIAEEGGCIVGWAVKTHHGSLIHVLVSGYYRGRGIGRKMIEILKPNMIRSKTDQSTGDPSDFYQRCGFVCLTKEKLGKNKNIAIYIPKGGVDIW